MRVNREKETNIVNRFFRGTRVNWGNREIRGIPNRVGSKNGGRVGGVRVFSKGTRKTLPGVRYNIQNVTRVVQESKDTKTFRNELTVGKVLWKDWCGKFLTCTFGEMWVGRIEDITN